MTFKVGETVVYPHHGAATIEEVVIRKIKGVDTEYLVLRVHQGDLMIQVPAGNVEAVGVRDVVDDEGVEEVLDVLREAEVEEPSNWSRRFKANQEKISNGDIVRVWNNRGEIEAPACVTIRLRPFDIDGEKVEGDTNVAAGMHLETMLDPTVEGVYALADPAASSPARSGGVYRIVQA